MKCHVCNSKLIWQNDYDVEAIDMEGITSVWICSECDAMVEYFTPLNARPRFNDYSNNQIKIALIGGARSGKDTIGNYLVENHGFKRLAFGDELKKKFSMVFDKNINEENKCREDLILFGQACREINPLVWVNALDTQYIRDKSANRNQNFVITDVRQENEVRWALENGFSLVKVITSDELAMERALELGEYLDVNNELDQLAKTIDTFYYIENNSTIEDLEDRIEDILKELNY